jgi:hypothetical protein
MLRIQLVREFNGDDVVLTVMDGDGLEVLLAASRLAVHKSVGQESALRDGDQTHHIRVSNGPARIEPGDTIVNWELPSEKLKELANKLSAMHEASLPCHNYLDIDEPTRTLYLSLNEYAYRDGAIRSIQPGIARQPT